MAIFGIFCTLVYVLISGDVYALPEYSTRNYGERSVSNALLGNTIVTDCFVATDYIPTHIEWQFATYQRDNTNTISVDFFEKNGDKKITKIFEADHLQENFFNGVDIPKTYQRENIHLCWQMYSLDGASFNTESAYLNENDEPIYRVYADNTMEILFDIINKNY